jgi:PPOX class probable F420-dependent enzyme
MNEDELAQFRDQKYISLETFRNNGTGVKTPVWFVLQNGIFYVYTEANSWKVKRILRNSRVRVAPCDIRGKVRGEFTEARAQIIAGEEERMADRLLDQKYFLKKIFNFLTKINRHKRAMIKIEAA